MFIIFFWFSITLCLTLARSAFVANFAFLTLHRIFQQEKSLTSVVLIFSEWSGIYFSNFPIFVLKEVLVTNPITSSILF